MLLFKRVLVVLMLLCIGACGFKPLYGEKQNNSNSILTEVRTDFVSGKILASYKGDLQNNANRMRQIFENRITKAFNPKSIDVPAKYVLSVNMERRRSPRAIQQDNTVTRYSMIITSNYTLSEAKSGDVIDKGTLRREGEYDAAESDYATYVSQEDTAVRVIGDLVEDFRLRVSSALLRFKKRG